MKEPDIPTDDDAVIEHIYEQAYEAAMHAITPFEVSNPYPPASDEATIFRSAFASHYARINAK